MDWGEVMAEWPEIETDRLLIRKMRIGDARDFFEYASDPLVTRFILNETQHTLEEAHEYLARMLTRGPETGRVVFGTTLKGSGKLIGHCGVFLDEERSARAEVAYALNRAYWGMGYAPEAARAVVDFGFRRLGLNRIAALCKPENTASVRVMEKVSMSYEGLLREYLFVRGQYWDVQVYAVLRREWIA